ncbi:MAG: hypothetical protein LBE51_08745 [Acidovorax sp.]|jgi:hypothetical protein|nr:hypothetical protein [Acidovorax sp.]
MRSPHPLGSLTLPRVPLTDRSFDYRCAAATNVATTIARERLLLAQEDQAKALAAIAAQPQLPGIQPEPTVRRVRAGLGQQIALPTL